jgi:hypothetical protein
MPFRVCAAFALITVLSSSSLFADPSFRRVRTSSPGILALIEEGRARSSTMRDVLARLEQGQWVVFILPGPCPDKQLTACLLHTVGEYEGYRTLRILVDVGHRHSDNVVASIAHELSHALEVVDAPEVIDAVTMRDFFRRIGHESLSSRRVTAYETRGAVAIGDAVRQELLRAPLATR